MAKKKNKVEESLVPKDEKTLKMEGVQNVKQKICKYAGCKNANCVEKKLPIFAMDLLWQLTEENKMC